MALTVRCDRCNCELSGIDTAWLLRYNDKGAFAFTTLNSTADQLLDGGENYILCDDCMDKFNDFINAEESEGTVFIPITEAKLEIGKCYKLRFGGCEHDVLYVYGDSCELDFVMYQLDGCMGVIEADYGVNQSRTQIDVIGYRWDDSHPTFPLGYIRIDLGAVKSSDAEVLIRTLL